MSQMESLTDLDDLDAMLGLGEHFKEKTPEEKFVTNYTYGTNPRIINMYTYLKYQMGVMEFAAEQGMHIYKSTMRDGVLGKHMVNDTEYARLLIEYFLLGTSYHAFDVRRSDKENVCKLKPVIDAILELPVIKKIILEKSLARY